MKLSRFLNCKDMKGDQMETLRKYRERKQEGEDFSETKKETVKARAGKHYKQHLCFRGGERG